MTRTSAADAAGVAVADLSETELISLFTPLLPRGPAAVVPTGDDAAVIAAPDGRFVVSTDVLVEGHHFRHGWGTARDVGARAAAQNLADVVAMGAVPTSMVVGLVLPPATPVAWVLDLARGLAEVCGQLAVGVDGGDLSAGDSLVVAVTVHGDLQGRAPLLRSGARPGDVLAHAGSIGRATAGYAVLATGLAEAATIVAPDDAATGHLTFPATARDDAGRGSASATPPDDVTSTPGSTRAVQAAAVSAFLRPTPPYLAGPAAAQGGASAMMDVSDGLLRDAGRMARASGVEIRLDPLADALAAELAELTPLARRLGADPRVWLLTGGEDHGLLATFPPGQPLPRGFRRLGTVTESGGEGPGVVPSPQDATADSRSGWDHFRST